MIRPPEVNDAFAVDADGADVGRYGPYLLRSAYQPIVRKRGDRLVVTAFEGLVRPSLDGRDIAPNRFFPLVDDGDKLSVERMCRALHVHSYPKVSPHGRYLFVNVDPANYASADIITREFGYLLSTLPQFSITPDRIICEIVETHARDDSLLRHLVAKLTECGFQVALDDFGRHASNFDRYTALKPGIVKIDRDYFRAVTEQASERRLFLSVMDTFARHGTRVLVEGIETRAELDHGTALGILLFQGFGIARPALVPRDFPLAFPLPGAEEEIKDAKAGKA